MIKILEIGKIFKARCPKCNCLFQYEKEDIQVKKLGNEEYSVIRCPQCSKEISTRGRLDIAIDDAKLSKEDSSMCDKTRKMCNWTITERDMTIFKRWQDGDSVRMIAMDEYVSTQRIYDIITKVRLFRGEEVYKDPYDLRYLQSITPRTRKFLVKRGAKDIKELYVWVKNNRLTTIPGVGEAIERKILIQLDDFMRQRREEEQDKKSE